MVCTIRRRSVDFWRIRDPFYVNRAWFYPKHLDETIMQRAADCFIGTHDFAAVRSVGTDVKSTVRTVYHYEVERDGDLISCRICARSPSLVARSSDVRMLSRWSISALTSAVTLVRASWVLLSLVYLSKYFFAFCAGVSVGSSGMRIFSPV